MEQKIEEEKLEEEGTREDEDATEYEYPARHEYDESIL